VNLEDAADRAQAETVACDFCGSAIGVTCIRADGKPLENAAAHTPRLAAAGVIHAPIDPRELSARGERGPRTWSRPAPTPRPERTRR
jgi:hypothetical protein